MTKTKDKLTNIYLTVNLIEAELVASKLGVTFEQAFSSNRYGFHMIIGAPTVDINGMKRNHLFIPQSYLEAAEIEKFLSSEEYYCDNIYMFRYEAVCNYQVNDLAANSYAAKWRASHYELVVISSNNNFTFKRPPCSI